MYQLGSFGRVGSLAEKVKGATLEADSKLGVFCQLPQISVGEAQQRICREIKVPSHPEDLVRALGDPVWRFERIGLEAGCSPAKPVVLHAPPSREARRPRQLFPDQSRNAAYAAQETCRSYGLSERSLSGAPGIEQNIGFK